MAVANITEATGDHYRFVIAAHFALACLVNPFLFEAAEITTEVRPAEFIVKRRAANRTLEHNI